MGRSHSEACQTLAAPAGPCQVGGRPPRREAMAAGGGRARGAVNRRVAALRPATRRPATCALLGTSSNQRREPVGTSSIQRQPQPAAAAARAAAAAASRAPRRSGGRLPSCLLYAVQAGVANLLSFKLSRCHRYLRLKGSPGPGGQGPASFRAVLAHTVLPHSPGTLLKIASRKMNTTEGHAVRKSG